MSGELDQGEPVPGAAVQGEAAPRSAMDLHINNNSGAVIIIIGSSIAILGTLLYSLAKSKFG